MADHAGQEIALPEPEGSPAARKLIVDIAAVYLASSQGDPHAALLQAVADGVAVASKVSRGFVRWGQPEQPRTRGEGPAR